MDIFSLRKKIDRIDSQILVLLNERAEIALQIGMAKKDNNMSLIHSDRETEILQRMVSTSTGPLLAENVRMIYALIIKICREIQNNHFQD